MLSNTPDTTPTEPNPSEANPVKPNPVEAVPVMQLRWVDPATLIIGANPRSKADLSARFIAELKERGVQEPITVHEDNDGRLVVRKGQRRTLGAQEAGLALVPVVVTPVQQADTQQREIDRLIDQLGENEHRLGLGCDDEVRATQELLDLGVSAAQIARKRHIAPSRVRTTVAVARSEAATAAVVEHGLDLVRAAVLAEFEDDPDIVASLIQTAATQPGMFDHAVQRVRDNREDARARAAVIAALGPELTVINRPDDWTGPIQQLTHLRRSARVKQGRALTPQQHDSCPGHAAYLKDRGAYWGGDSDRFAVVYVCTDAVEHGHAPLYDRAAPRTGGMSEAQKTQRRDVIRNNKDWKSASTVRRRWLGEFAKRKRPPAGAVQWITRTLAGASPDLARAITDTHPLAAELLGLTGNEVVLASVRKARLLELTSTAAPARATLVATVIVLAALEAGAQRRTWRYADNDTVTLLNQLSTWGYSISPVEQLAINTGRGEPHPTGNAAGDRSDPQTAGSDEVVETGEGSQGTVAA